MRNKLKFKMLMLTTVPFVFLAVFLLGVSYKSVHDTLVEQANEDMIKQCTLLSRMYDAIYPGDYKMDVIDEKHFIIYKGSYDITAEYDTMDSIKDAYNDDFSIFCGDQSVLTTLKDDEGNRLLYSRLSAVIKEEVIKRQEDKFYSNVKMDGVEYLEYFRPIINEDGTCFGMYGVYREASEINKKTYKTIFPIAVLYCIATVVIGLISVIYAGKIVDRILGLQKFMKNVSAGRFDVGMPSHYTNGNDELHDLARMGKVMQNSLRLLVECDELTKLNNRRYGVKNLEKIISKSANNATEFCVAIGDIDFFKKVNDTYGHDMGDEVLKRVAEVLKRNMAGKGFVARWGGEEFLFVYDMVKIDDAKKHLNDMLDEIRALNITYNDTSISVTMSFGLAEGDSSEGLDENVKRADERLYYAKEHGRNQVY